MYIIIQYITVKCIQYQKGCKHIRDAWSQGMYNITSLKAELKSIVLNYRHLKLATLSNDGSLLGKEFYTGTLLG